MSDKIRSSGILMGCDMDFGTTLRTARERRGLSVQQLATTTRITIAVLNTLEHNDFDKVPGGIFARGFIRSYAREVGLDPEEMVAMFLEETGDVPIAEPVVAAPFDDDVRIDPEPSTGRASWGYALIVGALLIAYVSSTRSDDGNDNLTPVAAAEELAPAVTATTAGSGEPRAVATTGNEVLQFVIAPTGPCWVEAIIDGKRVVYRLMQPGERETLSAREIALRVGDPAAFAYNINGKPGRALGAPGMPVSVTLTAERYADFLN
jgi:cytoskeleton protein RodZ